MSSILRKQSPSKGDCDCCPRTDVSLTPSKYDSSMMMCSFCFDDEATATVTVDKAEVVIRESRQNDAKITFKEEIMNAVTTSFIELHGAILADDSIPAESKKSVLADEMVARIKNRDAAIFAAKAALADMEQERFALVKNLQPLVATLRVEEQAKYKPFNVNYKPQQPDVTKIRKVAKSSGPKAYTPSTSGKKFSIKQIKDACEAAGIDGNGRAVISSMMNSPKNASLTLDEVIQKYLRIDSL